MNYYIQVLKMNYYIQVLNVKNELLYTSIYNH